MEIQRILASLGNEDTRGLEEFCGCRLWGMIFFLVWFHTACPMTMIIIVYLFSFDNNVGCGLLRWLFLHPPVIALLFSLFYTYCLDGNSWFHWSEINSMILFLKLSTICQKKKKKTSLKMNHCLIKRGQRSFVTGNYTSFSKKKNLYCLGTVNKLIIYIS